MIFIVAGVVLLLAFVIGTASFLEVPRLKQKFNESNDENLIEKETLPAANCLTFFCKENWKKLVFLTVTALLCAVTAYLLVLKETDWSMVCRYLTISLALLSAMIIDHYTHLIPNRIVLASLGVGVILLVIEFFLYREEFLGTLIASVVGILVCVVLFYVMSRLTKNGMGMGDVKLIAAMGWLLGLSTTMIAVLFSLILCTLVALVLLFGKKKNKNDKLPFGPFMFFGYIFMLLLLGI